MIRSLAKNVHIGDVLICSVLKPWEFAVGVSKRYSGDVEEDGSEGGDLGVVGHHIWAHFKLPLASFEVVLLACLQVGSKQSSLVGLDHCRLSVSLVTLDPITDKGFGDLAHLGYRTRPLEQI